MSYRSTAKWMSCTPPPLPGAVPAGLGEVGAAATGGAFWAPVPAAGGAVGPAVPRLPAMEGRLGQPVSRSEATTRAMSTPHVRPILRVAIADSFPSLVGGAGSHDASESADALHLLARASTTLRRSSKRVN